MTDLDALTYDFLRDDAGTPLGHGMPTGAPLRADGQSHYEAWQALLRRDPCAYCGTRGEAGTVDHVDPSRVRRAASARPTAGSTPSARARAATAPSATSA